MPHFKIQHDYRCSSVPVVGSVELIKGDIIELDEAVAEFISRDSPGALKPSSKPRPESQPHFTDSPETKVKVREMKKKEQAAAKAESEREARVAGGELVSKGGK